MPIRRAAVIIPIMVPRILRAAALLACAGTAWAADLQPRSYAWLMSHATLVIAGTVESVSGGLFGKGGSASVRVDGLFKGRWNRRDLEIAWDEKEFQETAYEKDKRVVVFAVLRKDSTFSQAAPGISCWPVERVRINGKDARAVEYAYPLDLLTEVPASALKTTASVEKSMNFRMEKRKTWIDIDNLLPPVHPFVLPKPPPPKPVAKRAGKPAAKRGKGR